MIDYANQIVNLISKYAPFVGINIGQKYQAISVDNSAGKVKMGFNTSDYQSILSSINTPNIPNTSYTTSGFYVKNEIESFTAYPSDSDYKYGIVIKFKLPHNLKKDQIFPLKGFTNTTYNTNYRAYRQISSNEILAFIVDTNIANINITTGLGYLPVQYTEGFNGVKTITNEGNNEISFLFDQDLLLVGELDLDFMPFIHNFKDNVKAINGKAFFSNLTDIGNDEYLLVDTTSLVGVPLRSNNNKTDLAYNAFSRSGRFHKSYTLNLLYLLERNEDDIDNQTISGSDIISKQVDMYDKITSIINQPLCGDNKIMSAIRISNDKVDNSIPEGRVAINYTLVFASIYQDSIMLNIDNDSVYPLDFLKVNNDEIDLTKF